MRAGDIEPARRLDYVPAARLEGVLEEPGLVAAGRLLQRHRVVRLGYRARGFREHVPALDLLAALARSADDRGLHGVLELADVPGPLGRFRRLPGVDRELQPRQAVPFAGACTEEAGQLPDILAPLRERRHPDG